MDISNRKLLMRGLAAIGFIAAFPGAAGAASSASRLNEAACIDPEQCQEITQNENTLREKFFKTQDEELAKARTFYKQQKYSEGAAIYDALIAELQAQDAKADSEIVRLRLNAFKDEVNVLRHEWGAATLKRAQLAMSEKRFNDAIVIASEAQNIDPQLSTDAKGLIDICTRKLKADDYRSSTNLAKIDPELARRQSTVKKLLGEAEVFCRNRRFDDARNRIEQVYLIDPYNSEAIELMSRIYRELYTYGIKRHETDTEGISAFAAWTWVEPVFVGMDSVKTQAGEKVDNSSDSVYARMERIIFPTIKFEDADIISVVNFLSNRSKTFDPEKEGVNIAVRARSMKNLPKVSLELSRIPMNELVRYICDDTGLKYRVESDGVLIGPEVDSMQLRSFQVRGNLIDSITGEEGDSAVGGLTADADPGMDLNALQLDAAPAPAAAADAGAGAAAGADGAGKTDMTDFGKLGGGTEVKDFFTQAAPGGIKPTVTAAMLKRYFQNRGVEFKNEASVVYDRVSGRLTVRNTIENLRRLEELIRQLDAIETPLVLVDIRLIQVVEKDFQELGFSWSFNSTDGSGVGGKNMNYDKENGWQLNNGSDKGWVVTQGINNSLSGLIRPLSNALGSASSSGNLINNLNIFPALFGTSYPFGGDIPFNLSLSINAMCQNTRTEMLSAPKILTRSGDQTPARIELVKTYYFPDSWETYELETDNGSLTITPPLPEFGDATDVGTIFEVSARVNPDNYTINLRLDPSVTEFTGKDIQNMEVRGNRINTTDNKSEPWNYTFTVWMPIIARRTLGVNVNVYDGHTLVLGGIIDNSMATRIDKWPLLGDLPLVGRFFQSRAEVGERRNMLLFVTARLVNNDGIPIRRNVERGMPDFQR